MKTVFLFHWRAFCWLILIFIFCLLPGDMLPSTSFFSRIPNFDKLVHFAIYFIFTLFLLAGFIRQFASFSFKACLISFIIAAGAGISIEFIQEYVGRSFDLIDMIANSLGSLVAIILFKPIRWLLHNIL